MLLLFTTSAMDFAVTVTKEKTNTIAEMRIDIFIINDFD